MQFVPELIVVGDVIGNGRKSTDPLEIASPKSQGGAEPEIGNAEQPCDQRAGRKVSRDGERFEAAGPIV